MCYCTRQGRWHSYRLRLVLGHLPPTPACPPLWALDRALAHQRESESRGRRPPVLAGCTFPKIGRPPRKRPHALAA
jgi:hypothetical protein